MRNRSCLSGRWKSPSGPWSNPKALRRSGGSTFNGPAPSWRRQVTAFVLRKRSTPRSSYPLLNLESHGFALWSDLGHSHIALFLGEAGTNRVELAPASGGTRAKRDSAMTSKITRGVLEGYLNCRYKGWLRLSGGQGHKSDYATLLTEARAQVRRGALDKVR